MAIGTHAGGGSEAVSRAKHDSPRRPPKRLRAVFSVASAAAALACLSLPAPAAAEIKTYKLRSGPFRVAPYQVKYEKTDVPAPGVDGFITHMDAYVVTKDGKRIPVQEVMMHHVVFLNMGRKPGERKDGSCGFNGERFYGNGEENQTLRLPEGYGYRIRAGDSWKAGWMLMNHENRADDAYIEYEVTVNTSRLLTPVTPYWVGVVDCRFGRDPIWNVPGGGRPGSTESRTRNWEVPRDGRIVAGGAHLHGGAKELAIFQPSCNGRRLFGSRPRYGHEQHPYYHVLPVLHEPGPVDTTWFMSKSGIPVSAGDPLRVTARYDAELPHTRVMGFMRLYMAPPRREKPATEGDPGALFCPPLPNDRAYLKNAEEARDDVAKVIVPIIGLDSLGRARSIDKPPGRLFRSDGDVTVRAGSFFFSRPNISIPRGANVRWRFTSSIDHDVTLANGPEGFGSRYMRDGKVFRKRFAKPGVYRTYCSLHPINMTQRIIVRDEAPAPTKPKKPNPRES